MSTKDKTNKVPLTDKQRIQSLESRVGELEDQMLICLEFMRYRAEKEAQQRTSQITAKETPQA